jgi:hypothetical protein
MRSLHGLLSALCLGLPLNSLLKKQKKEGEAVLDAAVFTGHGHTPASPGPVLAGFISGVALQLQQSALWPQPGYALCPLLACRGGRAFVAFGRSAVKASWGRAMFAFALATLLGFGSAGWRAGVFQSTALDPALEGRDIEVTGGVLAMPQPGEDGLRFRLGIESARLDGRAVRLPPQILLGWYSGFAGREPAPWPRMPTPSRRRWRCSASRNPCAPANAGA